MAVTSSGRRRHLLQLQNPKGEPVADGDGDYEQEYETFAEHWGSVDPATAQKLERFASAGPIASATHIVVIPFQHGVSILTRILYNDGYSERRLNVVGYDDPEERHVELVIVCQELKR